MTQRAQPFYPDDPMPVSLDRLDEMDNTPPGTWWGQPKYDGWRRIAYNDAGKWTIKPKPNGTGDNGVPLAADLFHEFCSLPWPHGIALDMELTGPRDKGGEHRLWVFDLFRPWDCNFQLAVTAPFHERLALLRQYMKTCSSPRVRFVEAYPNPGLRDLFAQQMTDPLSEGVVLRRGDWGIFGDQKKCKKSPMMVKIKYDRIKENP
jgi:ATP-dependent DNA ligase